MRPSRSGTERLTTRGADSHVDLGSSEMARRMLSVARSLFFEQGYDRTSVKDIADELGILKGSLYHYISSKEDLLFATIQDAYYEARALTDRAVGEVDDPIGKIHAFIRAYASFVADQLESMAIFVHEFRNLGGARRDTILAEREGYENVLRSLIDEAKGEGLLPETTPTGMSARAIFGMCNSIQTWYQRRPEGLKPEDVGAVYAELAVGALRGSEAQ